MRYPTQASHTMRHVERAADNTTPFPRLRLPCPAAVFGHHFPGWVIGRRRDDRDAVPARSEPSGHLARIFADTCELGRKIEADDEKVHNFLVNQAVYQTSVRILARQHEPEAHKQNSEIKPYRPALDVLEIICNAKTSLL
jgi:hypothetical protein